MKRSAPLRRTGSLRPSLGPGAASAARRKPPPERSWTLPRRKVDAEGACRICGIHKGAVGSQLQAAHVIGRDHEKPEGPGRMIVVKAIDTVPLCVQAGRADGGCHPAYDHHEVDLLPALTFEEQLRAVEVAGGVMAMLRRTAPLLWRELAPRPIHTERRV